MGKSYYKCPKCGGYMDFDSDSNYLCCNGFFCGNQIPMAEYLLSPDISMSLGKTKTNGNIIFYINSKTKKFAVEVDKVDNLIGSNMCSFGPFEIEKLLGVQVLTDNAVVYENKSSSVPMIAGGLLFGSLGAIAGSMVSNKKQKIKEKIHYSLLIKIDDIRIPSFYIETADSDLVYKFVNTIEFLRPQKK